MLPPIKYNSPRRKTEKRMIEFKGVNLMPVIGEGEFSDMANLSSRNYPCLSPRLPRVTVNTVTGATAFAYVGSVKAWILSNELYYNGASKGTLKTAYTESVRQLVSFQDRIIIWPDKMYYDITDNVLGYLENSVTATGLTFVASALDAALSDAVKYASVTKSTAFTGFSAGDGIIISGCSSVAGNNKTVVIDHISADATTLYFTENAFADGTEAGNVTVARSVPDMDYIGTANNRLWGCKGSTIYGSKLGSAENWNNFSNISTDSYSVAVSSAGDFTGCHQYGSYVTFQKENYIHKLIGTKPTNFQLSTIVCPGMGLESGSGKSLAYLEGILYYKAPLGVVCFNGGAPYLISEKLGTSYSAAVACSDGRRYYISMTNGTAYKLFAYDAMYNAWHLEDATKVVDFGVYDGDVYMLTSGTIQKLSGGSAAVEWSGTLGEFTEYYCQKKVQSKLRLRVELPSGSKLKAEYSTDYGAWVTAYEATAASDRHGAISFDIAPVRCVSYRVRLSGEGDCKIFQMDRVFTLSTDVG